MASPRTPAPPRIDEAAPPEPVESPGAAAALLRTVERAWPLLLAVLAALCAAPLAAPGWFVNHEEIRPVARALAAYHEIAAGDLYPRWLATGYVGKGVPLFNFYPPAFSLLVAYAHALGVPLLLATKLLLYALFVAGAAGVYLWVRPHLGPPAALVSSILYLFAPYHLVDLYVRGATAEFTALAALPFLFLAVDRLADGLSAGRVATLAVAASAIVLSHFLGALMIAPFAGAYAVARATRGGGWRALGRIAAATGVGAALSAFYWLPALLETSALSPARRASVTAEYYAWQNHVVYPWQWLDPTWGFGTSLPGDGDGMSFQVGLVVIAAVLASAALVRALEARARRFVLGVLGLGLVALALTAAVAGPLYAALPPLRLVQFPWRFLGPATLFLAAAGGGFVAALARRRPVLGPVLVLVTAAAALLLSVDQRAVYAPVELADDRAVIQEAVDADPWSGAFGNLHEFLPRDASVDHASVQPGGPAPAALHAEVSSVRPGRKEVSFEVTATADDALVVVPWHAFPGWQVTIDGQDRPLVPNPYGLVAFPVPPGLHAVRVHFGTTPPRIAGWTLCLLALGTLGVLALRERRARRETARS